MKNSNNVLSLELQKNDIGEETTLALRSTFMPFFDEANKIAKTAKGIIVTGEDQTDKMDAAREMRLAIKAIRVDADKKRKELKEDIIRTGSAIQGMYNIIKYLVVPIEEHLQKQEDFVKILEDKRKLELVEVRTKELRGFNMLETDITCYNLGEMSDEGYQQLRDSWETNFEMKLKLEREAEEKRIADKKAEVEERARIATENIKLKAEREESEKKAKEKLAKERAKLKAEREERQRLSVELEAREEAEALQKQEAQEAFRKAGLAPDKEKLKTLADTVSTIEYPELQSEEAKAILVEFIKHLNVAVDTLRREIVNL